METLNEILDKKPTITEYTDRKEIKKLQEAQKKAESFAITFDDHNELYLLEKSAFKQLNIDNNFFNKSQQLKTQQYGMEFLSTPYPASFITYLTRSNWVFSACAERVAGDIIRNGYDIITRDGYDEETVNADAKQEIINWFEQMPESITDVISETEYCLDTAGKAGIEIIRENGQGSPIQYLTNFDIANVKIASDERRILQTVNGKDRWFKIYDPLFDDGKYLDCDNGKWSDEPLLPEKQANEVIWFYRKDIGANLHGIPRIIKGLRMVELELGREEYNIDFFVNFGMPAWIVSITGTFYDEEGNKYLDDGTLNPDYHEELTIKYKIAQQIQRIIQGGRHGAIVMSFPTSAGQDPVQVTVTPLATDVKEASFRLMRKDNKDDLCSIMGISSNLIGPSATGAMGNNALESELIQHNDNRIKPAQKVFNNRLTKLIHFEQGITFNHDVQNFRFVLLDFIEQSLDNLIERDLKLVNNGVMTRLEFQIKHSKTLGINVAEDNEYMHQYIINGRPEAVVFTVTENNRYDLDYIDWLQVEKEANKLGDGIFAKKNKKIQSHIQTSTKRRNNNIQKAKQQYKQ